MPPECKPVVKIYRNDELICETQGTAGETLLQCIASSGVFLDSPCGGLGKCGKCIVQVDAGSGTGKEQVLACRTAISGGMDVHLPVNMEMKIATGGTAGEQGTEVPQHAAANATREAAYGVAFDIGTTTVVAHLMNIETGGRIATAGGVNAQRVCGADVISRINYCAENGHDALTKLIRGQIGSLISGMCAETGVQAENIKYMSIAANTIMAHLTAGLSPVGMGTVPFTPLSLFGGELPAWENLPVSKETKIYYAPAVSSYVGGDITAGILAAGIEDMPGPVVFIDVGTNGEIALKDGDTYFCCATAAGPAFEGAEISMGMAAVSGAVNHVSWDGGLKVSVIGGGAAHGICGSGLLDALALLVETDAVDETGRMLDASDISHGIARHICKVDGKNAFRIASENGGVYVTAADIRKLQLAKSAIAAGIQTLLHHTGTAQEDVKSFVLAGGFGSYMDPESAAGIGLFPGCFLPVTKTPGNTAGEGAVLALCSSKARDALGSIRERCEYIELSSSPVFNEQFTEQMWFP